MRQNQLIKVDRLQQLNDPQTAFRGEQLTFIRFLVEALRRISQEMVSKESAEPHIILTSPNGTSYRVTVADDGTLSTANVRA